MPLKVRPSTLTMIGVMSASNRRVARRARAVVRVGADHVVAVRDAVVGVERLAEPVRDRARRRQHVAPPIVVVIAFSDASFSSNGVTVGTPETPEPEPADAPATRTPASTKAARVENTKNFRIKRSPFTRFVAIRSPRCPGTRKI